jgi:hypothetical protein
MTTALPNRVVTEIPMHFRRHGGKTVVIHPDGQRVVEHSLARTDQTLIKVIARAFRWERLLRDGTYATVDEIAKAEDISPSYVSRVIRITLLAPDIITAVLEARHPPTFTMRKVLNPFPLLWSEQVQEFGFAGRLNSRR